ncbi:MAG TPA: methylated-DNA--[protein]-cysteine S-methyltransferase [Nevskia sp.]|jgi:AraC family transcriptional regulator of adaptative response/methylated-DNA-[protein]-cysteine methyltransferase|nr:methylated-DNA--[protein]-cysteine S-methyltransferase [Nevskia sp.]
MSETIRYAQGDSSLGPFVVAASAAGLVALQFGAADARLPELELRFPQAVFSADAQGLAASVETVHRLIEQPGETVDLPLDLRGSEFELRVWRALRKIPPGETSHYGAIAASLGTPRLSREVGQACSDNPLALIVPCHRVLKKDGSLSGYRWGKRLKRTLLEREQAVAFHLTLQASG